MDEETVPLRVEEEGKARAVQSNLPLLATGGLISESLSIRYRNVGTSE